jgi:hypothetical protein|tara:strand:+ start:54 stop:263 length:210 start_codon:yes stop_codon:yes gene_type:complete
MTITEATVAMLNHELFLKGQLDLQVDVSIGHNEVDTIDLWDCKSGDLLNSFEDCDEAISAISSFILPRI